MKDLKSVLSFVGVLFAITILVERYDLDDKIQMAALPIKFKLDDIKKDTEQRVMESLLSKQM
jgi:hypothetical protein